MSPLLLLLATTAAAVALLARPGWALSLQRAEAEAAEVDDGSRSESGRGGIKSRRCGVVMYDSADR